jgi:nucleoside-diphosphate-sugar epimerase
MQNQKIILAGGAGLVGLNLIQEMQQQGFTNILVLDKHQANLQIAAKLFPTVNFQYADLAIDGEWKNHLDEAKVVVMLQAQIGDLNSQTFVKNNIVSTQHMIQASQRYNVPYIVHISSSVVNSVVLDDYVSSKKAQEKLVMESGISYVVLRPTLMFGWFDRKHLGWLSRWMKKIPIFPVPGNGRYSRQPLYVRDFCRIIVECLKNKKPNAIFDISGLEKINYIDMIRDIKKVTHSRALILKIPYWVFFVLLKVWSWFDSLPPFTTDQLRALLAKDEFEVIDWPNIFNVKPTPWLQAVNQTFTDSKYSNVTLKF